MTTNEARPAETGKVYAVDDRGLFCRHCGRARWLHRYKAGVGFECVDLPHTCPCTVCSEARAATLAATPTPEPGEVGWNQTRYGHPVPGLTVWCWHRLWERGVTRGYWYPDKDCWHLIDENGQWFGPGSDPTHWTRDWLGDAPPTPTPDKPVDLPTDTQVREAMQTTWDDFCDDAQAIPGDIYREAGKTFFRAGTWADHTAMHLRAALAPKPVDLGADAERGAVDVAIVHARQCLATITKTSHITINRWHLETLMKAASVDAKPGMGLYGRYHKMLLDLLAVIHRDGGHKTQEIGINLAWEQAMQLSSERIATLSTTSVDATIERCAQVADDMILYSAQDIATAIRSLSATPTHPDQEGGA